VVDALNALSKLPDSDAEIDQEPVENKTESTPVEFTESKEKKWWNPFD